MALKEVCSGLFLLLRQRHPEWDPFLRYTETIEELAGLAYIAAVAALPFALPVERSRRLRMSALVLAVSYTHLDVYKRQQ